MLINLRFILRLLSKSLIASPGTGVQPVPKRIALFFFVIPAFLIIELINWICLLLDEIIFPRYRQTPVTGPLFIVGVPRSGTTFLHRLIAKDAEQFTCMKLWEELFAPSIIQKNFWRAVGRLDEFFGEPAYRLVMAFEKKFFSRLGHMHKTSLFEPEEDEIVLFHVLSTVGLSFVFPYEQEIRPFAWFDLEMPLKQRMRIMSFYKRCVQKHLYVFGRGKRYLSKNPTFSPKVASLYRIFPDAKVVCMVRNPFEAIPSSISLFAYFFQSFSVPLEPYPMIDSILEMFSFWYRYPLNQLEKHPPEQQAVIKYDALVQDPRLIVLSLYERFSCTASASFQNFLLHESERSRTYRSRHSYSLEQCGISPCRLRNDYRDILDCFGF